LSLPHRDNRIGVLLVNLGTPDAPTPAALRRYLAEFLWDPRVVDLPRWQWWPILNLIILNTRPAKSAALYKTVWTEQGAPLLVTSRAQTEALSRRLAQGSDPAPMVVLGMRYGNPGIPHALDELRQAGCDRILVLPLFPQYSCATGASVVDAVAAALKDRRDLPELRFVKDYHDHPGHIAALAASVREHWHTHGEPDTLLVSFHGTPERFRTEGDPYHDQCQATAHSLAQALGLAPDRWRVSFQSRFGKEPWLTPYTDEVLAALPGEGIKRVDLICPGFAADCLETLEEIAETGARQFTGAGGEVFHYIPALNQRPDHVAALADLVQKHTSGWPPESKNTQ